MWHYTHMDCCRVQWCELLHCGNVILPKAKIKNPNIIPMDFRPEWRDIWGLKEQFSFEVNMTLCCAINSTSARNKQSIFVLLSHHQKCTLIAEISGLYFSWIVDKNSKVPHNFSWWQVLQFIYWLTFRSGIFTENNEWHFSDIFGITWQ